MPFHPVLWVVIGVMIQVRFLRERTARSVFKPAVVVTPGSINADVPVESAKPR